MVSLEAISLVIFVMALVMFVLVVVVSAYRDRVADRDAIIAKLRRELERQQDRCWCGASMRDLMFPNGENE